MATPYRDGPIYDLRCGGGHKAQVLRGNPKHEILFQMGAYSLLDGVYRDVVSTIGSSLEEFWEFSLQCVLASQNVQPLPVPRVRHGRKERFEKHWSKALGDATILHDNESMNYRRLADYMSHLRKLDELFSSLRDESAASSPDGYPGAAGWELKSPLISLKSRTRSSRRLWQAILS